MVDVKSKLDKHAHVSPETFENFHQFLLENVFTDIQEGTTIELTGGTTTFSYLHMRYLIRIPDTKETLSLIVLGGRIGEEVFTDYLKCDFAIVNHDFTKLLFGVRVFEGKVELFKQIFDEHVLPTYQKYKKKSNES